MEFTFIYKDNQLNLSSSNTRSIFSNIDKEVTQLELILIDGEKIKEDLFKFYKTNGKIIIPIRSIKKEFYNKALKYVEKEKIRNKRENREVITCGKVEKKSYENQTKENTSRNSHIRGIVMYNPKLTTVFRSLESFIIKRLVSMGFEEIILPKITPWNTWLKTGHLISNYSEIMPLCKTTPLEIYDSFYRSYFEEKEPSDTCKSVGGMTYSQCENFWSQLETSPRCIMFDKANLLFDRSGPSYRQERKNISGIKRLAEFRRIELIFTGKEEELNKIVENLLSFYQQHRFQMVFQQLLIPLRLRKIKIFFE